MSETIHVGHLQVDSPWGNAGGVAMQLPELHVVSSGGVTTGQELDKRLSNPLISNVVAGAGTTFYHESGDWRRDTDKLLRTFAAPRRREQPGAT